jgi:hypothetical protein
MGKEMISFRQAFEWCNHFDPRSYLFDSSATRVLNQALNSPLTDEQADQVEPQIKQALADNLQNANRLGRFEALVKIAVLKYEHHQFADAGVLLEKAIASLTTDDDRIRLAAIRWMMGMIQFSMKDDHLAYLNWSEARILLHTYITQPPTDFLAENLEWFIQQVWLMNLDLARIPEEALEWARAAMFGGLHINSAAALMNIDAVFNYIFSHQYKRASDLLKTLPGTIRDSQDPAEKGGIELTCGVCHHLMKNHEKALEVLYIACSNLPENSHQRAVTQWIIGIIEWQLGNDIPRAVSSWQAALERFKALQQRADHHHHTDQVHWYEEHLRLMQEIFENYRADNYPF